jgi:hypothetical protein
MWRWLGFLTGLAVVLGSGIGCTRQVPIETGTIDPRLQVVVTFSDGSRITGKLGTDERVDLMTRGEVYRGRIQDVTLDSLLLRDCRLLRSTTDRNAQWARVVDARLDLGEAPKEFAFRRADITRVERVKLDPKRTASQSVFWALTGTIAAFLLAERS